jgi:hypothetical protein
MTSLRLRTTLPVLLLFSPVIDRNVQGSVTSRFAGLCAGGDVEAEI